MSAVEFAIAPVAIDQVNEDVVEVVECECPSCTADLEPFTVVSFEAWAATLTLDNGKAWAVEDWFAACVEDYFAGVPENWWIVPEGNAKTTSVAGLALYLLEHRVQASIPWAASSRDQAELGYRQAEGFVLRSRRLRSFVKCQEGYRRIKNLSNAGRMQVFAADDKTGDGIIPTDAFLDELHRQKDLKLYRTWRGKLEKRGGQMATFSTAGVPGSEFEETREFIRQTTPVVEQRPGYIHCRSEQIVLHEYAVDAKADVEDMAVVKRANPFSGVTETSLAAKRSTPTMTIAHWRRMVCNLATRGGRVAIEEAEWHAKASEKRIPEGEQVWAGLDVAWKWDTTALVPLWTPEASFRLLGEATILTPPRDGSMLHPDEVKRAIVELNARNPIHTLVMDMSQAADIAAWVADGGDDGELSCEVIDRDQSNAFQVVDYDNFMEGLREWLWHSADPGLSRHVLNAVERILPGGESRFDRPTQTRQASDELQNRRVTDGLTAAAMVNSIAAAELADDAEPWTEVW